MIKKTKEFILEHISGLKEAISNEKTKNALKNDPLIKNRQKKLDEIQIQKLITLLRKRKDELFPYLKLIKKSVPNILDETSESACYLLIAQIFKLWDSLFILGEQGKNVSLMVIIRTIKEYNMLVSFFAIECKDRREDNLKDWFKGQMIMHSDGRKKVSSLMKDDGAFNETDIDSYRDLMLHVYSVESALAHPSYVSVLENIDVFTKDYDFESFIGINRCVSALEYACGTLNNTTIAMKSVFRFVLNDQNSYKELSIMLNKYHPDNLSPDEALRMIRS